MELAVPGLKLTGWWRTEPPDLGTLKELNALWPSVHATIKLEHDILEDPDLNKHQICAYIRILKYPHAWLQVVEESLKCFVDRGAAISWAGGWECFLHYSRDETFAGCYAAYTLETGLICHSGLDEPLTYLEEIPFAANRLHSSVAAASRKH